MQYLLFVFYFTLICLCIAKLNLVKQSGLGIKIIFTLFTLKVLVGVVGALISYYVFSGFTDMNYIQQQGLIETKNLMTNPKLFFTDSLPSAYGYNFSNFFSSENSFWNDLRNNIILKLLGILNIFSRGSFYINILFFNGLGFIGSLALFNIYKHIYNGKNMAVIIGCFLLPSCLYFTSIIGKDVMIFTALSCFFYALYFALNNQFTLNKILCIAFTFLYILLTRSYVAIILLPIALIWFIQVKFNYGLKKIAIGISLLLFTFCGVGYLFGYSAKLLNIVVYKQQEFFKLEVAKSQYINDTLQANLPSFIAASPKVVRHAFLSPLPMEFNNIYLNAFAAEMFLYFTLLMFAIFWAKQEKNKISFFELYSIIFSCAVLFCIGYIVTNAGALIRYRSIYLPFLITPILCRLNIVPFKKRH